MGGWSKAQRRSRRGRRWTAGGSTVWTGNATTEKRGFRAGGESRLWGRPWLTICARRDSTVKGDGGTPGAAPPRLRRTERGERGSEEGWAGGPLRPRDATEARFHSLGMSDWDLESKLWGESESSLSPCCKTGSLAGGGDAPKYSYVRSMC